MIQVRAAITTIFVGIAFTNVGCVCAYTTRSYDLDVPGARPIRIIEADPGWNLNVRITTPPAPPVSLRDTTRLLRPDFEHRTLRPDPISHRNDEVDMDYKDVTAEKLKKFLKKYAQKHDNLQEVAIEETQGDELVLKDKFAENVKDKPETAKSWNLLHFERLPDNKGEDAQKWVSMDAVPWSVSKIAKWHGKPKKEKYPNYEFQNSGRPFNDRFHQANEYQSSSFPKRPAAGYSDYVPDDVVDGLTHDDDYAQKLPTFSRPTATYGQKVNVQAVQHPGASKRPQKHDCIQQHQPLSGHQHGPGGEIITDGLPSNFPDQEYGNRRRGGVLEQGNSHPFKGDGEWVLLSTTKGYKYSKNRQRSIQFSDANGENAIQATKSVKLTVLPPLDDGRVNMTTSHGGLLQVDATFQSVDEAQRQYAKKQNQRRKSTHRPTKKSRPRITKRIQRGHGQMSMQKPQPQQQRPPQSQSLPVRYHLQGPSDSTVEAVNDSKAVLAAVGAGMIPAGMALLMPIAINGK